MIVHLRARNLGAQTVINAFGDGLDAILKKELKAVRTKVVPTKGRLAVLEVELPPCPHQDAPRVLYHQEKQMQRLNRWLEGKALELYDLDGDFT